MSRPDDDEAPGDSLARMRVEYGSQEKDGTGDLDVGWLGPDAAAGWSALLLDWIADARRAGLAEPNAMVVATVDRSRDPAGRPAARTVLCKAVDAEGITFYTNYGSAKGDDLAATPYACATFGWYGLGRQVHVAGPVQKVTRAETEAYFAQRPRGSQLGAWASQQSRPVAGRAALLAQLDEVTRRFADSATVPAPPDWGGMRIRPETVEFWQGRENRMHNRIRVHPHDGRVERLQP